MGVYVCVCVIHCFHLADQNNLKEQGNSKEWGKLDFPPEICGKIEGDHLECRVVNLHPCSHTLAM